MRSRFARHYDRIALETLAPRAAGMRNAPTPTESKLWRVLRQRGLGVKFRRQVLLGPYIVDFYCPEVGLVVEVDGPVHELRIDRDASRDAFLNESGYQVVRISSDIVEHDLQAAVSIVVSALRG